MADETKRIIDQDNDQALSAGDYVMVDSQSEGTRKFDLGSELRDIKEDLSSYNTRITALEQGSSGSGLTDDIKTALLQLAAKVAYIDDDGQDYYDDLEDALYPPAPPKTVSYIDAVYTQSGVVYDTDTLDSLKSNLVVTAHYTDSTSGVVTNYTLSGTLTEGTSTITVSYGGKSTTFTVIVTVYSTAAVIMTEGAVWDKTAPNTYAVSGFGITQWYDYEFTQAALEACSYWDSTNGYMSTNGWTGLKYCTPDYLTYAAGYSWPAGSRFKNVAGKDHVYTVYLSITRNTEYNFLFSRYSVPWVEANGVSFSIPLLDIDYCYAYWKSTMTYSIYPTGVSDGDIIFAGKYTPYYNLTNISQAPTLSSISATFTQGSTVVTTSTALNDLKPMLSVTATYSGNKTLPVNLGLVTLSGTLTTGTSTITATYNSKTTTFNVTVS